jgi:hypothetical protein
MPWFVPSRRLAQSVGRLKTLSLKPYNRKNEWRCPVEAPFILLQMHSTGRMQKAGVG